MVELTSDYDSKAAGWVERAPTEWQCTCGAWLPVGYSRHPHYTTTPKPFEALYAMRRAAEAGLSGAASDSFEAELITTYVLRTKGMPTR